jgi:hypothetical protein
VFIKNIHAAAKGFTVGVLTATVDGEQYAIGQLQSNAKHAKIQKTFELASKAFQNGEGLKGSKFNNFTSFEIDLGNSIDAVNMRAGAIIEYTKKDDAKPITIEELHEDDSISISDNVYIQTADSSSSGEAFVLYSQDKNVDINSTDVRDQLLDRDVLKDNLPPISSSKLHRNNLGLIPFKIRPPFLALLEYRDIKNSTPDKYNETIAEFPNLFSYTMMTLIVEYAKQKAFYTDGKNKDYSQEFNNHINNMYDYLQTAPETLKSDIEGTIKNIKQNFDKGEMSVLFNDLIGLVYNDITLKSTTPIIKASFLEKGETVFRFSMAQLTDSIPNVEGFIERGLDASMDFIMEQTRYSLSIPKDAGIESVTGIKVAKSDFMEFFMPYAYSNLDGLDIPWPAVSPDGYTNLLAGIHKILEEGSSSSNNDITALPSKLVTINEFVENIFKDGNPLEVLENQIFNADVDKSLTRVGSIHENVISYIRYLEDNEKRSNEVDILLGQLGKLNSLLVSFQTIYTAESPLIQVYEYAEDRELVNALAIFAERIDAKNNGFTIDSIEDVLDAVEANPRGGYELQASLRDTFNTSMAQKLIGIISKCN